MPPQANRSFHSVFHRLGSFETLRQSVWQVSQNQELTKIRPVYCAVSSYKKARAQMARGPRSNRRGNKNSALTRPSTPVTAIPKMRRGKVMSHTSGYITRASKAMGQHKTKRMHHRKKAAMATSLRRTSTLTAYTSLKFRPSPTTTMGKAEKFRPRDTHSVADAWPLTTGSPHPAACASHRSPNAVRAQEHESLPRYVLQQVVAVWKA